jgi:hypothetical protein
MGKVAEMTKRTVAMADAASLAAEIAKVRADIADANREAEASKAASLQATSFEDAEELGRKCAAAQWRAARSAEKLPDLQAKHAAVVAVDRAEAVRRHLDRRAAAYQKLKVAIIAASDLQAEALALDAEACREVGEHIARMNIPVVVYRGLLFPDLVQMWAAHTDRAFEFALGRKALAPVMAPAPSLRRIEAGQAPEQKPAAPTAQPAPMPNIAPGSRRTRARALMKDQEPLEAGQVRIMVVHPGFPLPSGDPGASGDVLRMPADLAHAAARSGAVEILERSVPSTAAPTTEEAVP